MIGVALVCIAGCTIATEKRRSVDSTSDGDVLQEVGPIDAHADSSSPHVDVHGADTVLDAASNPDTASDVANTDNLEESDSSIVDVQFDAPCEPDCEGKVCGSNGCSGICGYCTYPAVCDAEGQCVEVCEPECDGKNCGPDGCGGDCGICDDGLECGDDGLCYEKACVPDCGTSTCGPDGCGGDCGLCAEPKICGIFEGCSGLCCALGPCGTVDEIGECQGDVLVTCFDKVNLVETNCAEEKGFTCLYDPIAGAYGCAEEPECVPKCSGKQCGADGCGGSCGVCTSGWSCELGVCKKEVGASCGNVTVVGSCENDVFWFCTNGKLFNEDCSLFGQSCGFIAAEGSFGCK